MPWLLVPLGLLAFLLAATRALFGLEEPATELAVSWDAEPAIVHDDAGNAWFWLVGLGASESETPVAHARRWLDVYHTRRAVGPLPGLDASLARIAVEPTPMSRGGAEDATTAAGCPDRDIDCVRWARYRTGNLDKLEAANALRLARYEQALTLSHFQTAARASLIENAPTFDVATPRLHLDLIARDIAADAAADATLVRLERVARFWRIVAEQGDDTLARFGGDRMLERVWRLAMALADRHPVLLRDRDQAERMRRLWSAPTPEHRNPARWLRAQHRSTVHAIEESLGTRGLPTECLQAAPKGCLVALFSGAAYSSQATRNLSAATWAEIEAVLAADADEYERALEQSGETFRVLHPMLYDGDFVATFRDGNPTGRIMAAIGIPAFKPWAERRHDLEALRRIFAIKQAALTRDIRASAMPGFLSARGAGERNPYTGEPFEWDPLLGEIVFATRSQDWKRARFTLALRPAVAAGVQRCDAAIEYRFIAETGESIDALGCSHASRGVFVEPDSDDFQDPEWQWNYRFESMTSAAHDTGASVRILWRGPDGESRAYEALDLSLDAQSQPMQALGHDEGPGFRVAARRAPSMPRLSLDITNHAATALAAAIERLLEVELLGAEAACGDERITVDHAVVELDTVLDYLSDLCGSRIDRVGATSYRFESGLQFAE